MAKKQGETPMRCALCGSPFPAEDPKGLIHKLVAHGPLTGSLKAKRRKVRMMLPRLHSRLEKLGYNEGQAHQILQLLAEELRTAGVI